MTKMQWTPRSIFFPVFLSLSLVSYTSALAVFDPTTRCADLLDSDADQVCLTEFEYYWIPDYLSDPVKGWKWIYNAWKETEDSDEFVGERVMVYLALDEETCDIGLGGNYGSNNYISCRTCTFCGFRAGGPDERDNAAFSADCTNIPGGRLIDTCESTFPFYYPVDWFDPLYGTTATPTETSPTQTPTFEPLPDYCEGDLVFDPCGNTCPPACTNAIPIEEDGGVPCIYSICSPGCYCPSDKPIAVGDDDGTCVASRDECPNPPTTAPTVKDGTFYPTSEVTYAGTLCGGDLVFITCGGTCPQPTCENGVEPGSPCSDECISGCYCPPDRPLLVDGTGVCVETLADCPTIRETMSPTVAPTIDSTPAQSGGPSSFVPGASSIVPSLVVTPEPTIEPTAVESGGPSSSHSGGPSIIPSLVVTSQPTSAPTAAQSSGPSSSHSEGPSSSHSEGPSMNPSLVVTSQPTSGLTAAQSGRPSLADTLSPSSSITPTTLYDFRTQLTVTLRGENNLEFTTADVDNVVGELEEFQSQTLQKELPEASLALNLDEYNNPLGSDLVIIEFTTQIIVEGSSMSERQVITTLADANYSRFIHRYLQKMDGIFNRSFRVQYKAFGTEK